MNGKNLEEKTMRETKVVMLVGGARSRRSLEETQTTASTKAHGGVNRGRGHGGNLAGLTKGMTDGDRVDGGEDPGGAKEPMGQTNTDGSEDLGGATATSFRGGSRVPED